MDKNKFFEYLLEIIQEASLELLKIYHGSGNQTTNLIFPLKRDGRKRISEQEMRFALTSMIDKFQISELEYSVETPTEELYSFSGGKKRSAASDLSLYYGRNKALNIELKAHNPSISSVSKDINKLVCEPCPGAWIHLFENEDSGTMKSIIDKFCASFQSLDKDINNPISFHFLILKTGTLISRKGQEDDVGQFRSEQIFNIDYTLWKNLKPGKYQYRNGTIFDENSDFDHEDWQIDKFDLDAL